MAFTNAGCSKSMFEALLPVHEPESMQSSSSEFSSTKTRLASSELMSAESGNRDSMGSEEAPQLAMEATGLPGGGPLFTIEVTEFAIEATLPLLAMETTGLPRAGPLFTGEATELSSIEATVTLGLFGAGVP